MNSEKPLKKATAWGSDTSLGICAVQPTGMVMVENAPWVTPVSQLSRFSFLRPLTYHFQRTFCPKEITHFRVQALFGPLPLMKTDSDESI